MYRWQCLLPVVAALQVCRGAGETGPEGAGLPGQPGGGGQLGEAGRQVGGPGRGVERGGHGGVRGRVVVRVAWQRLVVMNLW